ncbi:bone morphogenetic protein receptor type-2 [Coccinella septempunctata]|uniref:bone morphogenetic protein receptor type-2 n=1 Tax=Coccinella septempunctata TaxID=41139 RepID=UPI001D091A1E|nr:bone morphogenetic protein receptor type-2 [Coccinella septempunctata]
MAKQMLLVAIFFFYIELCRADGNILCATRAGTINFINDDGRLENRSLETTQLKCNYCYTLWQESSNASETVIMGQGCWDVSGLPNECDKSACTANTKPSKVMNNTKFCCCSTNMCNENFTDIYRPGDEPPPEKPPKQTLDMTWLWLLVSFVCCFIFLLMWISCWLFAPWKTAKKFEDVESTQPLPPSTDYSLDKLKLLNVIGQGRYGSVWRGLIDDQEVAVKMFPSHHRNYFLNEHNMYKASGENSALLKCFGGGEYVISPGGPTEYLLLLSLEQECLQEYLKKHTLDLPTLGKMSLGVAKGLAHLHSDLGKPCIAHRDINTRNILVRTDLSCCICDLGLAVTPRAAENRSLTEAGTLRYMAPEVLEGAVNLRDCESALKQIDVYALGLVLWELGSRCTDMQNGETHPYSPPFYKEAGENPSLEQMQTLVSRRKVRPLWPQSWKDTAAARLLCETAEDCWDQDAEARLTSLCVVERLLELPHLKGRVLHPMHPPASPTPLINNNHLHDRDRQIDVSVRTVETLLSPTEENCKNSNQLAAYKTPMQPYQGRNPCLERNLNSGSSDNLLIDKSLKHCSNSDSQNLITNDFLNFQINHRATPIPYLQNAVHGSPKRYNNIPQTKRSRFKWNDLKSFFSGKKHPDSSDCKQTQVKLSSKLINSFGQNGVTTTLLGEHEAKRPSTLSLSVVKPKESTNSTSGVAQILKSKNGGSISRQQSIEHFNEVFCSTMDLSRLKDPSCRVKTPGDVPPSVRRTRGKAAKDSSTRFSLYDDRIMCRGQWGSAPDLEPQAPLRNTQMNDPQDRDSISSF